MIKALLLTIFCFNQSAVAQSVNSKYIDQLLLDSKTAFYKDDFDSSIKLLEQYFTKLENLPKKKARSLFRFYAIGSIGQIYLQQKHDPKGAIDRFEKIKKTNILTEAESSIVDNWINGIGEWIKLGKLPKDINDAESLFEIGKKYYEAGLAKQKYTMDIVALADFSIAASYLIPFIVHFDKNIKIGEVLFMMGDIRSRTWSDNKNWSQNFYLTETIRRFPNTTLAVKAYRTLNDDVHFGYTGSSGDHTPSSWIELLSQLKKVAEGKTEKPIEKVLH